MTTITQAGVLPYSKQNGTKFYYFGLTQQGKLSTFSREKKQNESNRHAAIHAFIKQSLNVFVPANKTYSLLKKPQKGVERVENKAVKEVIYVTKLKTHKDFIEEFRKRAGLEKLHHHKPEFQQIIAIKAAELSTLIKNNVMSYHSLPFRRNTWSTLQTAFISKNI
jgi:hypothetical protein